MQEELNMEIPNEARYISIARLTASGLANRMDFKDEDIEDIKVCLSEACNNIVQEKKGRKNDSIDIHFHVKPNSLVIEVDSQGNELDEKVWEKRHELGKTFVETLMDDVKYSKHGKGTTVEMVKYLPEMDEDLSKYKH